MLKVLVLTFCLFAIAVAVPVADAEGDGEEPFDIGTIHVQKSDPKKIQIGGAFYVMRNIGNEVSFQITLTDKATEKQVFKVEKPFCDFFKGVFELFPAMKDESNIPSDGSCPTTGVYTINDLVVDDKAFDKIPSGDYELEIEIVDSTSKRTLVPIVTVGRFEF